MVRTLAAIALVLVVLSAGCLGGVDPASIPSEALQAHQWHQSREARESRAGGLVDVITRDYAPVDGAGSLGAGVTLVSVTDVPVLDEKKFIPRALEDIERQRGISFNEVGPRTVELANVGSSTGTEYTISGAPVPGMAVLLTPSCGDFVVLVAWGATSTGGGLLLPTSGENLYEQAIEVASTMDC